MLLTFSVGETLDKCIDAVDSSPWPAHAGRIHHVCDRHPHGPHPLAPPPVRRGLYTPEERVRRDASPWTVVQGILAPLQFLVFLVSLGLVLRYLATGEGLALATGSIVVKTGVLYAIMITGSVWERDVFGKYLFARSFFWEDVVSMLVIALHTAYLVALVSGALDAHGQMLLALAAYAAYVVNATQFLLKLRAARLQEQEGNADAAPIAPTARCAE